jgi:poly(hydroxyalkanoate) depolymerase family esterase
MARRPRKSAWTQLFERSVATATRSAMAAGTHALRRAWAPARVPRSPPQRGGSWLPGLALGPAGARRFQLYRPPDLKFGERLPLLVMLHGCDQDAEAFAASTRMNRIAQRERFLVLYPEQDRMANAQRCWNWFDTTTGRAQAEAASIVQAIEQVCLLHAVDRARVAIAGLSAGASMAALLVTRQPGRFKALVMHSGIPPGTAHSGLTALRAMRGRRSTPPTIAALPPSAQGRPPLLVIHGGADFVVSPANGRAAAAAWAVAAGALDGTPRRVQRGQRYPMTVTNFKHQGSTVTTLVEIDRLAHAWSGGASGEPYGDLRGPDASRMVWAFVARQFGA